MEVPETIFVPDTETLVAEAFPTVVWPVTFRFPDAETFVAEALPSVV